MFKKIFKIGDRYFKNFSFFLMMILSALQVSAQVNPKEEYEQLQKKLQTGWDTFNTNSVLSHVLLPEGLALNIGVKSTDIATHGYLKDAFISSRDLRPETIVPGNHALDGSYTDLTITWNNARLRVQSAVTPTNDLVLLVTPLEKLNKQINIVLEVGMLWNKAGLIAKNANTISASISNKQFQINAIGDMIEEFIPTSSSYLAVKLDQGVGFYTGSKQSIASIKAIVNGRNEALEKEFAAYNDMAATYKSMQNVIAWNTIYDDAQKRVITPVSRLWSQIFGGQSVLFCWDTYFVSYMASMKSKELAYANAIEITKSITPNGFIPNWAGSYQKASFDRSQPPVGSMVFKELYRKYQEKWLLEYVFEDLMKWNRWWEQNRDNNGLLCWGSNKVLPPYEGDDASHNWQGAAYESGLDNSPMYDDVPFNKQTNMLELADVGLMSLYVMDCNALAEIAKVLNKKQHLKELQIRGNKYRKNMSRLWNEKAGIYMNLRTDTKEFSPRLSPTNFYPLLAKIPSQQQAKRMVDEHLLNPKEFNGEWMLPSIAINDVTFKEQKYWRGRIWGPMNFLVYIGLLNYKLPESRTVLSNKSNKLFMENVTLNGWVFENYNGITGNVTDQAEGRSEGDNYYHWGALLGFIPLIENGFVPNPSAPLNK